MCQASRHCCTFAGYAGNYGFALFPCVPRAVMLSWDSDPCQRLAFPWHLGTLAFHLKTVPTCVVSSPVYPASSHDCIPAQWQVVCVAKIVLAQTLPTHTTVSTKRKHNGYAYSFNISLIHDPLARPPLAGTCSGLKFGTPWFTPPSCDRHLLSCLHLMRSPVSSPIWSLSMRSHCRYGCGWLRFDIAGSALPDLRSFAPLMGGDCQG